MAVARHVQDLVDTILKRDSRTHTSDRQAKARSFDGPTSKAFQILLDLDPQVTWHQHDDHSHEGDLLLREAVLDLTDAGCSRTAQLLDSLLTKLRNEESTSDSAAGITDLSAIFTLLHALKDTSPAGPRHSLFPKALGSIGPVQSCTQDELSSWCLQAPLDYLTSNPDATYTSDHLGISSSFSGNDSSLLQLQQMLQQLHGPIHAPSLGLSADNIALDAAWGAPELSFDLLLPTKGKGGDSTGRGSPTSVLDGPDKSAFRDQQGAGKAKALASASAAEAVAAGDAAHSNEVAATAAAEADANSGTRQQMEAEQQLVDAALAAVAASSSIARGQRCGLASSDASTALLTRFRKLAERRQQLHQQVQHYSSSSEPVLAAFAAGVSTILSKQCAAVQAVCTMVQACYGVQPGSTSVSLLAVISHLDRLVSQVQLVATLCRALRQPGGKTISGAALLDFLYEELVVVGNTQAYPVVRYLLALALKPYLQQLRDWLHSPADASRADAAATAATAPEPPPCPRFLSSVEPQLRSAGLQLRQLHKLAPHIGSLAQRLGVTARSAQHLAAAQPKEQDTLPQAPAGPPSWQVALVSKPESALAAVKQDLILGTTCDGLEGVVQRQQQACAAMEQEVDWVLQQLAAKRQAEEKLQELAVLAVLHDRQAIKEADEAAAQEQQEQRKTAKRQLFGEQQAELAQRRESARQVALERKRSERQILLDAARRERDEAAAALAAELGSKAAAGAAAAAAGLQVADPFALLFSPPPAVPDAVPALEETGTSPAADIPADSMAQQQQDEQQQQQQAGEPANTDQAAAEGPQADPAQQKEQQAGQPGRAMSYLQQLQATADSLAMLPPAGGPARQRPKWGMPVDLRPAAGVPSAQQAGSRALGRTTSDLPSIANRPNNPISWQPERSKSQSVLHGAFAGLPKTVPEATALPAHSLSILTKVPSGQERHLASTQQDTPGSARGPASGHNTPRRQASQQSLTPLQRSNSNRRSFTGSQGQGQARSPPASVAPSISVSVMQAANRAAVLRSNSFAALLNAKPGMPSSATAAVAGLVGLSRGSGSFGSGGWGAAPGGRSINAASVLNPQRQGSTLSQAALEVDQIDVLVSEPAAAQQQPAGALPRQASQRQVLQGQPSTASQLQLLAPAEPAAPAPLPAAQPDTNTAALPAVPAVAPDMATPKARRQWHTTEADPDAPEDPDAPATPSSPPLPAAAGGTPQPSCSSSALAPVQTIVECCVVQPILQHHRLLTRACWSLALHEFKLLQLCAALRRFFFLEAGDFAAGLAEGLNSVLLVQPGLACAGSAASSLSDWGTEEEEAGAVGKRPGSREGSGALLQPAAAQLLLSSISQSCCASDPYAERLQVAVQPGRRLAAAAAAAAAAGKADEPAAAELASLYAGDEMVLGYAVPDPLVEIITPDSLQMYADACSMLLRVRRTMLQLHTLWRAVQAAAKQTSLSSTRARRAGSSDTAERAPAERLQQLLLWLQNALHMVTAVQGCMQHELSGQLEVELRSKLNAGPLSFAEMAVEHAAYVAKACERCFVQVRPGMQRLQQLVLQLLATAWHFQATAHLQLAAAGAGSAGGAFAQLSSEGSWAELQAAAGPMQQSITELGELLLQQVDGNEQVADLRARAGLGRAC